MDAIDDKLTDPACFATHDPHEIWKQMRARDPIHWARAPAQRLLVAHPL